MIDISIKLSQLDTVCRVLSSLGLSNDDSIFFKDLDGSVVIEAYSSDSKNHLMCITNTSIAKPISVAVNNKEFISYITYIVGYKLGGDVSIGFDLNHLFIKYKCKDVSTNISLPYTEGSCNTKVLVKPSHFIDIPSKILCDAISKAVAGTSNSLFSNAFNGVLLFKHDNISYVGGTDTVKCVILPVDVDLPDDVDSINLTVSSINILTAISKLTGLSCRFGWAKRRFRAEIGNFIVSGPLHIKTAPIQTLLSIDGDGFVVNKKLFLNAIKGSMQASKKDIYKAVDLSIEHDTVHVGTKEFSVVVKGVSSVEEYSKVSLNASSLYSLCSMMGSKDIVLELKDGAVSTIKDGECKAYISPINK